MNWHRVLTFFKEQMLLANPPSGIITPARIALPNESFDKSGLDIWFEIALVTGLQGPYTEEDDINQAYISLITCVPKNTGNERSDAIARRLKELFSVQDGSRGCFQLDEMTIFIKEAEQLPGIVVNEVFKTSIRLFVEIYEAAP